MNGANRDFVMRKGSAKIVSPRRPELDGAQVAALINPSTHSWDQIHQNMVDQNFLSFEANRIKAIPLCWTDQCDRIIWPDSPDGEYSVKAGYQKLCEEADASNASSSDPTHQKSFWKKVWKLQFPNKIKNLLWRVCSNALPTKENLKKRKIIEDARCSACLSEQESTFHAIWDCEKISHVWAPCFSWVRTEHPQIHDIQELINMLGQQVQKLELFGVVAWALQATDWRHSSIGEIVKDTVSMIMKKSTTIFDFFKRKVSNDLEDNISGATLPTTNVEENPDIPIEENLNVPIIMKKSTTIFDFFKRKVSNDLEDNISGATLPTTNVEENPDIPIEENLNVPIVYTFAPSNFKS
nr:uncharacterized protein LOC112037406 [Quercus suber]